jgi:hypothetical protein
MKLSEIKGERFFEVMADLLPPVMEIASDPEAIKAFTGEKLPDEDNKAYTLRRVKESFPYLMRTHSRQLLAILEALEGRDLSQASALEIMVLFTNMLNDREVNDLFTSAGQTNPSSGSASTIQE